MGAASFALKVAIEMGAGLWAFLLLTEGRGVGAATAPYCLLPAIPPATNPYWTGGSFDAMNGSKPVLAACASANLQKWNASPSILASLVNGYHEN